MIRVTTEHSASNYGIPVILDDDELLDYREGVRRLRKQMKMNTAEFGRAIGVSPRTVECWEQGVFSPSAKPLYKMVELLRDQAPA